MISREKSSRGSNSPRRPTRSDLRKFCCKFSRSPAELAREDFPTAGHANRFEPSTQLRKRTSFRVCAVGIMRNSPERTFQRLETQTDSSQIHICENEHRFACAPSGPCPARVCKPSRSPRRRGAACLSARTCVPRRSHKSFSIGLSAHTCVPRRSHKSFRLRVSPSIIALMV